MHHLRRTLGLDGLAWITGERAGLGTCRYPRRAVLSAFEPHATSRVVGRELPWLLLSTDVAAEGLNLQRVARVVHYDLPWTSVRLEQRDGRALRRGALHPDVRVVRFDPPPVVDRYLELGRRLTRKAALPGRIGVGERAAGAWAWHEALEDQWSEEAPAPGWAAVSGEPGQVIAAFTVDDGAGEASGLVLIRGGDGQWREDPAALVTGLEPARGQPAPPADEAALRRALHTLVPAVRRWLRAANGWHWLPTDPDPGLAAALRVARERSATARRERRLDDAREADQVLGFLAKGHSAGERMLAARIAWGDGAAWRRAAAIGRNEGVSRRPLGLRLRGLLVSTAEPGPTPHSAAMASSGRMRAARIAGSQHAASAATASTSTTPTRVPGSNVSTP